MQHGVRLRDQVVVIGLAAVLVGCGGPSTPATPTSSPTAGAASPSAPGGPAVSPSPVPPGPAAPDVAGYTLVEAPAAAKSAFEGAVTSSRGVYTGLSVYTVTKGNENPDGRQIGGLVLFGVYPEVIAGSDQADALAPALLTVVTAGSEVTTRTESGITVHQASAGGSTFEAWLDGEVLSLCIGNNARQTTGFVNAAIAAG